jgi:hypothetical protein
VKTKLFLSELNGLVEEQSYAFWSWMLKNSIKIKKTIIPLNNKLFDYLSKILWLYIYNPLVLYFISSILINTNEKNPLKATQFIVSTFCVVIFVAQLSYFYFEKRFLNIKDRYTTNNSYSSNPND